MSGRRAKRERRGQKPRQQNLPASSWPIHGHPDFVYFYLPLPDTIKVAHLTELPVKYVWNPIADDGPCIRLPSNVGVEYAARQILIFHQDEVSMDLEPLNAAMKIMSLALENSGSVKETPPRSDRSRQLISHTTVEVICVLDPAQINPVDHALDQAIQTISHFQTYYHLSTKTPTRRLTRKVLPPVIPIIRRSFDALDTWEGELLLVNDGRATFLAASAPTMSAEQLQNLLTHADTARAEIFNSFLLMRQEAQLSYNTGSNSAASLFIAIAAETLLTELFLLLSWEEDVKLNEASAVIGERDNISKRLLSELASKLKGDWDRNGNGPIGEWQRRVANLRNEVAHAGTIPSGAEIDTAMKTLSSVEAFVGDRLADSISRYPIASNWFLGKDGLERRRKLKSWQVSAARVEFPHHASQLFAGWKKEVQRLRLGPNEGRPDESVTTVVLFSNGTERWFLVDEGRSLSCAIESPALPLEIRHSLDTIKANTSFDVTSVSVPNCRPLAPIEPQWVPSFRVLPSAAISRWEQCLWVAPLAQNKTTSG